MSGDLYRDAHVGIRARLAELEARIQDREAEVTEAFWETLEPALREQLVSLRAAAELATSDSLEELARAEGMLAAYIDELDRRIATLPAMEAEWAETPDEVADPPAPASSFAHHQLATLDEATEMVRAFTAMVRERERDAVVEGESPSYVARFRDRGAPFALRATIYTNGNGQIAEVAMWLVTSIARALPKLVVRHETLVLSVGKALGLKHEVEVGEPSFDGLFLIEGTKEAADLFLVPAVRTQLLVLARYDVPTLDIDPQARTASLRWRFEPAPKALDAAIRILVAVRESRSRVRFRTE
jgi:hypothetical protein